MPTINNFIQALNETVAESEALTMDSPIGFTLGKPDDRVELVVAGLAGAIYPDPKDNTLVFSLTPTQHGLLQLLQRLRSVQDDNQVSKDDGNQGELNG